MLSATALEEFKSIWRSQFGEDVDDATATEEAVNLLTMFDAVYRPIRQEWLDEYENPAVIETRPASATS